MDVKSGLIRKLTDVVGTWSVLDVLGNIVIASFTSFDLPPQLVMAANIRISPYSAQNHLPANVNQKAGGDRKSTRLNSSHVRTSRMPSSA